MQLTVNAEDTFIQQILWFSKIECYIIIIFCSVLNCCGNNEVTQEIQQVKNIFQKTILTDKTLQTDNAKREKTFTQVHGSCKRNKNILYPLSLCTSRNNCQTSGETSMTAEREGSQENNNMAWDFTKNYPAPFVEGRSKEKSTRSNKKYSKDNLEEFDRLRIRDLTGSKQFPSEKDCPYLGIRIKSNNFIEDENITCQVSHLNDSDCEFIKKYFGAPRESPGKSCPKDVTTDMKPLCWFGEDYRNSIEDSAGLQCNISSCSSNLVYLGVFNTSLGHVLPDNDWPSFNTDRDLEDAICNIMKTKDANHFRFCFLRCAIDQDSNITLKQILIFAPIVQLKSSDTSIARININIVVEDAVSRDHFYRSLSKTVDALRYIVHNPSVDATVLDFEKYQSYDSSTHSNIQRLFTGSDPTNNLLMTQIKELYQKYKNAGYQTMFQEDACWFDGFGSLLRSKLLEGTSEGNSTSIWTQFRKLLDEHIQPFVDTFGVGFSSCKILQDLGNTNIFNGESLPTLCFNGYHLSSYFLKVTKDFHSLYKTGSHSPAFSYVHLNSGHEHTGKRITNDDDILAKFLKDVAKLNDTLTILLSDHGGKTMQYATGTAHGLKEIYKPFLFMIIPRQVAEFLGNDRMRNLIKNQNQLVALEDLHLALKSLVESDLRESPPTAKNDLNTGLFSEISMTRKCSDFKLSPDAICQCENEEVPTQLDSLFVNFLANIGVGEINNLIHLQYTKGLKSLRDGERFSGYGRCHRYVLKRVERVRCRVMGENRFTTFSVIVATIPISEREEIFEVTLRYPLATAHGVSVTRVSRISPYSMFKHCVDPQVDLYLCTCQRNNSQNAPQNFDIWKLFGYYMFDRASTIRKLYGSCIYLIITQRQRDLINDAGRDVSVFYEVINVCDQVSVHLTVSSDSMVRIPFILSTPLPWNIVLHPNTMHHLISAFCGVPYGEFIPVFNITEIGLT